MPPEDFFNSGIHIWQICAIRKIGQSVGVNDCVNLGLCFLSNFRIDKHGKEEEIYHGDNLVVMQNVTICGRSVLEYEIQNNIPCLNRRRMQLPLPIPRCALLLR